MTQKDLVIEVVGIKFPASLTLVMVAIVVWGSFFLMDRYWYHVLLKGAVNHNMKVEAALSHRYPNISLGKTISEESAKVRIFGFKLNSNRRLNLFYGTMLAILVALGVGIFLSHPQEKSMTSAPPTEQSAEKAAAAEPKTASAPGTPAPENFDAPVSAETGSPAQKVPPAESEKQLLNNMKQ